MEQLTIGFIGLGLIGGSLAKSIRKTFPEYKLYAWNHRRSSIEPALQEGVLDGIFDAPGEEFSVCDIIFLCAPVQQNVFYLECLAPYLKEGSIISDVGSTKTRIHEQAQALGLNRHFIGGHPMAGSEKFGYAYSTDYLLENAYYILTPCPETTPEQLSLLRSLIVACGSLAVVLDYRNHDRITAAISHVPHIIASSLVNLVRSEDDPEEWMKRLAAGGFKDITRIASSSPVMWQEICMANRSNISSILRTYIASLQEIADRIEAEDETALYRFFDSARIYRNSIPSSARGSLPREYALYCDIRDESGAIASIATLLSGKGINIKNIAIVHNRESEEGVLRVEFYDEDACIQAEAVLTAFGRSVHRPK